MSRVTASLYSESPTRQITFSQGVNDTRHETQIADDEVAVGTNYIQDPRNASGVIKRPGVTKVVMTDLAEIGLVGGTFQGIHDIYVATATKIFNDAGTAVATGLTSSTQASWASMRLGASNLDIFTNGTEVKKTADGSTFANLASGSPPAAFTQVVTFANRLWGFKNNKLYWSDLQDPDTWDSSANSRTFSSSIRGLLSWRGEVLVVFFEDGFQWLTFPDADGVPARSYSTKALGAGLDGSHASIVDTEYGIFWWNQDGGMFSPDGRSVVRTFQRKLRGTLEGTMVTTSGWSLVNAVWNPCDRCVICAVPVDGESITGQLYYYPEQDAWWTCLAGQGVRMASMANVTVGGRSAIYGTRQTLISGTGDNYIYKLAGNTDDGTSISASLVTKRYDVGNQPGTLGRLRRVYVEAREVGSAVAMTLDVHPNNQGFTGSYVTLTMGGTAYPTPKTFEVVLGWRVQRTQYRLTEATAVRIPIVRLGERVQVWSR